MCVSRGREDEVQGSGSSLGHLQFGILGEDKADGSSLLLCGTPSADFPPHTHTYPPLTRLQAQKRGAILRDKTEAGADNLV